MTERTSLDDEVKNLQKTIDTLMHSLCWERDQWPALAIEIATREGLEEAIKCVKRRCMTLSKQVSI
jgi:hypothetical protein